MVITEATDPEATAAQLDAMAPLFDAQAAILSPREGYPKVIASGEIEGLEPGQALGVLGICPAGAEVHRAALEAVFEGGRAVPVDWPDPSPDCPDLGEAPGEGLGYDAPEVASAGRLSVVVFPHRIEEGELQEEGWDAMAVLRDEQGRLVTVSGLSAEGPNPQLNTVTTTDGVVRITDRQHDDPCVPIASPAEAAELEPQTQRFLEGQTLVRVEGTKILTEVSVQEVRTLPCPPPQLTGPPDTGGAP